MGFKPVSDWMNLQQSNSSIFYSIAKIILEFLTGLILATALCNFQSVLGKNEQYQMKARKYSSLKIFLHLMIAIFDVTAYVLLMGDNLSGNVV